MEEEEPNLGGSIPAMNIGGEGNTSSQLGTDPPSMDQKDVDLVIEEVAKDAEAKADRIAAEEAGKIATEEAAKGPAGEAGKAAAEGAGEDATGEADKAAAEEEVAIDQPPSPLAPALERYLKKLQALHRARSDKAKSRMATVDKAEADFKERVTETQAWFCDAHQELKAVQGELAERKQELILKQADIKKDQELAKEQAAKDEAARQQH
nr:tol-Pal system protein TolA-like [Aegilops tauschii subsp. strangulata]